MLYSFNNFYCC